MKKSAIILVLTMNAVVAAAQRPDKFVAFKDTGILNQGLPVKTKNFLSAKSILAPGALILYGFGSLQVEGLKNINVEVKEEVLENNPGFRTHVDDYLQFAPAAGTFLLEAGGIKGKHNLKGKAIIYGIGLVIMTTVVSSLKKITHQLRPDGSKYNSFPSGHTAAAFMGAEFLKQEYSFRSTWYGYAGYATAASTGVLRMYNNKHWFTDVVTGAGLGILSSKASYWIFSSIEKKRKLKYSRTMLIKF